MREFICIDVSALPGLADIYADRLFGDPCIKDSSKGGLHFTLHFLGEIDETQSPALFRLIDAVASRHQKFMVTYRGTGAFPSLHRPSVIWAGVSDSRDLELIHQQLGEGLVDLGIPVEGRRFAPHITLARIRCRPDTAALNDFFHAWQDRLIGQQEVSSICLKESVLSQTGAIHHTLHESHLCR
jgi:2'-5' RNA ligase